MELHIENLRHLFVRHVFTIRELDRIIQNEFYNNDIIDALNPYTIYMLQPHLDVNDIQRIFNKLFRRMHIDSAYKYDYESDEDSPCE